MVFFAENNIRDCVLTSEGFQRMVEPFLIVEPFLGDFKPMLMCAYRTRILHG